MFALSWLASGITESSRFPVVNESTKQKERVESNVAVEDLIEHQVTMIHILISCEINA